MWSVVDLEPGSLRKCLHLEELTTPWGERGAQGPDALQRWAWLCRADVCTQLWCHCGQSSLWQKGQWHLCEHRLQPGDVTADSSAPARTGGRCARGLSQS